MRLKTRLLGVTSALVLAGSFAGIAAPAAHAAPIASVDVTADQVHCDSLIGSIKFGTALRLTGTPTVTSNTIGVKLTVDGCSDQTNPLGLIAASKFAAPLVSHWTSDSNCQADGSPASPIGSGSNPCHGAFGGGKVGPTTIPAGDYVTDEGGAFGSNSCLGLQGFSDVRPGHGITGTATATWKAAKGGGKLLMTGAVPAVSTVQIGQTSGVTFASPFLNASLSSYGEFQVGTAFGTTPEIVSGAFKGPSGTGAASTFDGITGNSSGALGAACFGATGIKGIVFGIGDLFVG